MLRARNQGNAGMLGQELVVDVLYGRGCTSAGPGLGLPLMNYLFYLPMENLGLCLEAAKRLSGFSWYLWKALMVVAATSFIRLDLNLSPKDLPILPLKFC
jgi:hypothetical protein